MKIITVSNSEFEDIKESLRISACHEATRQYATQNKHEGKLSKRRAERYRKIHTKLKELK